MSTAKIDGKRSATRKDGRYQWDLSGNATLEEINEGFMKRPSPVKQSSPTKSPLVKKVRNKNDKRNNMNNVVEPNVYVIEKQRLISIHNAELKKNIIISIAEIEEAKSISASKKKHAIAMCKSEIKLANEIANCEKRKIAAEAKAVAESNKKDAIALSKQIANLKKRKVAAENIRITEAEKLKRKQQRVRNKQQRYSYSMQTQSNLLNQDVQENIMDSAVNIDIKNFNEGYNNDTIFITCGCCGQER